MAEWPKLAGRWEPVSYSKMQFTVFGSQFTAFGRR